MGILDFFKKTTEKIQTPFLRIPNLTETAKGQPSQTLLSPLSKRIGLPHPHDMKQMNLFYHSVPIIQGAINKIVDFTVGPGFRITSEDERVQNIVQAFMKEQDFDNLLRQIVRDVLIYGNAYLEIVTTDNMITQLIPRNPETMYVKRDEKGNLLGYTQVVNKIQKPIDFSTKEIAHFKYSQIADDAYGTSIIYPCLTILNYKLSAEKNLNLLIQRKANAPYDIKVGTEEEIPTQNEINQIKTDLEDLRNDQEWVHDSRIEINALGFKDKVMDFSPYLAYYEEQIIYGLEVPQVLLGKGNVPEGLAVAQKEAFERKIISIQLAIENVLETDVFQRVLENHGLVQEVEFEWKESDPEETRQDINTLISLTQVAGYGMFSPDFIQQIEQRLAELLNFEEIEQKELEELPQPMIPGQQSERPVLSTKPSLKEKKKNDVTLAYNPKEHIKKEVYDANLKEFIGFNYKDYLQKIIEFVNSEDFVTRTFKTFKYTPGTHQTEWEEVVATYHLTDNLSKKQVDQLRTVLITGFEQGSSINEIRKNILKEVKPQNLLIKVPAVKNEEGEILRHSYNLHVTKEQRAMMLSRNEVMRANNQGILKHYDELGIKNYEWSAANDIGTCAYCESQHGVIVSSEEADELLPAHDCCRCIFIPLTE